MKFFITEGMTDGQVERWFGVGGIAAVVIGTVVTGCHGALVVQGQSSAAGGHVVDSALRSRVLAESGLCLGYLVFDGEGVKADRSEAVKYFRLAAGAGCKEAEQVLGWMYNTGQF